jgi:hypothetical protein
MERFESENGGASRSSRFDRSLESSLSATVASQEVGGVQAAFSFKLNFGER